MSFDFKNSNNAVLGMTMQKVICDLYGIVPHKNAITQFETSYDRIIAKMVLPTIKKIFKVIGFKPVECLTFAPSNSAKEKFSPHNFILENGATLSIRTNKSGDKVAPRVVGQCGLERFNEHFDQIAGYKIEDKQQIKKVVWDNIHLMIPIFIDYLFVSDYTVWVYSHNKRIKFEIIESNKLVDIDLSRTSFSFTKDLNDWNESTTLKYKEHSLAEIQIHKNRTFKFRFIMSALLKLLKEQKITFETLGITAEKTVCDLFHLKFPLSFYQRYSKKFEKELMPTVKEAFKHLPDAIKHTGSMAGERGGGSKCSYDFILKGNEQLSLKTNTGKMVCPPEVGQPASATCYMYFKDFISEDHIDGDIFKKMVLNNIEKIMPIYISHLFDSDFLLWIYRKETSLQYKIFKKGFAKSMKWQKSLFSFTKEKLEEWNESNTVKYKGISIGEFQVHKARDCYKFRFNLENLEKVVSDNKK